MLEQFQDNNIENDHIETNDFENSKSFEDEFVNFKEINEYISVMDASVIEAHTQEIAHEIIENKLNENWENIPLEERMERCDQLFEIFSDKLEIPADFDIEVLKENEFGYFDGYRVVMNVEHLENDSFDKVLDTMAHECRHAYQQECMSKDLDSYSGEYRGEIEGWKEAVNDYSYFTGFCDYHYSAIEQDAREYANNVLISVLKNGGAQ
ncbi:MAG: hypothetical protein HQK77_21845 [Desulfobacterales bacterium]|nr:hypothetical protein [Desulfobacterales bacterium]